MMLSERKSEDNQKGLAFKRKLFFENNFFQKRKEFFKNSIVFWLFSLSIFFNLVNWVALAIFVKPVDETIILHYNVYFGVDSIGHWGQAYLLPAIGLILLATNLSLADYFYLRKERMASHILMMTALMAQLSLLIASVSVILINY